jgi:hypothetical protein
MTTTNFTAQDYFTASQTRNFDSEHLKVKPESIIFALYCAGVSVECMLRAFITKETTEFNSRHNIEMLYKDSKLGLKLDDKEKEKISAAIRTVSRTWSNSLRYTSEKRMKRLVAHELVRTTFKDINKYLLNRHIDLFDAVDVILQIGKAKWN